MRYFKIFLSLLFFSVSCYAEKPDLMLLENYKDQNVIGWVMSEKLDGVRGYWDGKQLFTRGGIPLMGNYLANVINLRKSLLSCALIKIRVGIH